MSGPDKTVYQFGEFRLDSSSRLLLKDGVPVQLMPKAFDMLLVLVENRGRLLEKEVLMNEVWPDSFVEEANLTVNISALRRALGESPNEHRYIVTIPGRGYKFVADVSEDGLATNSDEPPNTINSANIERAEPTPISGSRHRNLALFALVLLLVGLAVAAGVYFLKNEDPNTTADSSAIKSIAVLPFKPLAAETRDESLEMGMADTLIFKLSNIRGIVVRPISAVRKYTDLNQDPLAAGREQQVDAVLDTTIQRVGDKVRVMARLLRVSDGSVLWTEKGDQQGGDLFTVQDAIAEKLAGSLALTLTDEETRRLYKRYTENAEAYQLYLLGRFNLNKGTPDGYNKGIEYFQQAIAKDSAYALAYTGLADCYTLLGGWQITAPGESFQKARAAAEKALELDNSLAEAHTSLALVKNYSSDWREAESEFRRAIDLNPNDGAAHRWYGVHLMGLGRLDESLAEIKRAIELDPLSLPYNAQLGRVYYMSRDYDRAIEQYQKTFEIDPNFVTAHLQLGWAYEKKAMYNEALAEYQTTIALQQAGPGQRIGGRGGVEARIGRTHALAGQREEALRILADLKAQDDVPPYNMALIYDGLGDEEQAIAWLEKVFEVGSQRFGLKIDPTWDRLREHPKFQELLRRLESTK